MSVSSWQQPSQPQLGLGSTGLGVGSTSSSDYGNWFQSRPALTFPSPALIPRRNPTRKLGALSITEGGNLPYGGDGAHRPQPQDPTGTPGTVGNYTSSMDQSGKFNSFLSKVNQESRVPRSPRTPDLLDLPGRIVRAPRTRHMTPRNSPDAEKHAMTGGDIVGKDFGGQGSENMASFQSPRYNLERSNTMMDTSSRNYGDTVPYNPYGLTRSNTNLAPTGQSLQQRALQPLTPNYVIPTPLERSNTMTSFNPSHYGLTRDQPPSLGNADSRYSLQRSHTTLDGSKISSQPTNNTSNPPAEQNENRLGWNFRRVPTFHGPLPGSNNTTTNNGITHRPLETFQPAAPAVEGQSSMSRYMFSTMPTSNALRTQEADLNKPRIPMYWLYGSRGRPGTTREDPTWPPSSRADHISRDHVSQHHLTQDGRVVVDNGGYLQGHQVQNQEEAGPAGVNAATSESDFLSLGADRRDPYRSNYSSYTDQRTQSEPDRAEFTAREGAALETASLPDDQARVKSILKKNPSSNIVPPSFPTRAGPGKRLPHMSALKKSHSKRVTFAL